MDTGTVFPASSSSEAVIIGWGYAVPEQVLTNADLAGLVDTSDEWIVERTGIKTRHIVQEGESTLTLAIKATQQALLKADLLATELDLIIFATSTPDYPIPPTACLLQSALGATRAAAFDLQATCSSFLYALAVAKTCVGERACRNVLVVGAETISRFTDYTDRTTCVLFGDGAGAVILNVRPCLTGCEQVRGLRTFSLGAGGNPEILYIPAGGSHKPATFETVAASQHYIKMKGQEIFKLAVRTMSEGAMQVLRQEGLTVADVDLFIPHQANLRIIEAVGNRLGITTAKTWLNIARYGNTGAASIAISLGEAADTGCLQPGMRVLMTAFGAGLTWAAGLIYW